jgi:hypothetical protein
MPRKWLPSRLAVIPLDGPARRMLRHGADIPGLDDPDVLAAEMRRTAGRVMTPLTSLRAVGLTNEAIGSALTEASGRPAPSPQRVQDWLSELRPTPQWATQAAAAHLCRLWEMDRRSVPDDALARCDASWAAKIDRVLGELYAVLATVPDDVRMHMRTLTVCIRSEVSERLSIELPGV